VAIDVAFQPQSNARKSGFHFPSGIAKNQKPLRDEAGAAMCSAGSP
jgi:hypothetical protein